MDFKQLEAFVKVVSLKSFSLAAKELFLTQPTVSAHITSLERELQTVLIVRTTKEVYPSPQGEALFGYAVKLLEMRDHALTRLKSGELNRTVTVAAPQIFIDNSLGRVTRSFQEKHPNALFKLSPLCSAAVEREVQKGAAQMGIVAGRSSNPKLKYHLVASDRLVFVLPRTEEYNSLTIDDLTRDFLNSQTLFADQKGSGVRREVMKVFKRLGVTAELHPLSHSSLMLEEIAKGRGMALMCSKMTVSSDAVRVIEPPVMYKQSFYIVIRKTYELSGLARQFLKHAKSCLATEMGTGM